MCFDVDVNANVGVNVHVNINEHDNAHAQAVWRGVMFRCVVLCDFYSSQFTTCRVISCHAMYFHVL